MMKITLNELFDAFLFYPEKLGYFDESANVEDSIFEVKDMEDFVKKNGDRKIESFTIEFWKAFGEISLQIVLK